MKKILAIAVAAAFAAPAIATADTTLYGKLNAQLNTMDLGNAAAETDIDDWGSRIGVKGSTPLNNGLAATYVMEYGADLTDNDQNSGTLSSRQTYVGVKGGFGEVRVGKMWGPTKLSSGKVEMFGDRIGDYNGNRVGNVVVGSGRAGLQSGTVEPSVKDAIAYVNKFGNVGVAVAATEDVLGGADNSDTVGGVVFPGDVSTVDSMVNYSNNGVYLALGHQEVSGGPDTTRLTGAYAWPAGHQIGAAIEKIKSGNNPDVDSYVVSGKYKMGNVTLKGQHAHSEAGNVDADQTTLGLDYSLGKKTTLNADITTGEQAVPAGVNGDFDGYALGITHSF